MKIWLLGAHQPTNARLALDAGAPRLGLAFNGLLPRLPTRKDYLISERFPDTTEIYLASGGHTLHDKGEDTLAAFLGMFEEFVRNNASRLSLVTEVDDPRVAPAHRLAMQEVLGDKFAPVWLPEHGADGLEALAASYATVAVRSDCFKQPMLLARLAPLHARYGTRWHLLDGARPDELMTGRFHSAATTAWLSPMKNGETIVWDGVRMSRYPARMQDQARRRHRSAFTQAGYDADRILEGDYQEITRYTVSAFLSLEDYVDRRKPLRLVDKDELSTSTEQQTSQNSEELVVSDVDNSAPLVRNENRAPLARSGRQTLPVFAIERRIETEIGPDGKAVEVEQVLARKGTVPLRACDSCHVAATCPAFNPGHECAYDLPLEIKTKEQLSAALAALLGKQMDRVAFMMMQEELSGGYADPNTSSEIKLLMDMVEKIKNIEDNRASIKFQVEAKGQAGVLSALFGEQARKLSDLPQPIPSRQIENIIDADVIN